MGGTRGRRRRRGPRGDPREGPGQRAHPVQWDDGKHAGFTLGEPWIGVNPNYPEINVAQALADPDSVFHYYRKLIRLRREHPVLVYGRYDPICEDHEQVYAYTRTLDDERLLVMLNFSADTPVFVLPDAVRVVDRALLIANYPLHGTQDRRRVTPRPYEARVYLLSKQ